MLPVRWMRAAEEQGGNGKTKRWTEQVKIIYKSNLAQIESLGARGPA